MGPALSQHRGTIMAPSAWRLPRGRRCRVCAGLRSRLSPEVHRQVVRGERELPHVSAGPKWGLQLAAALASSSRVTRALRFWLWGAGLPVAHAFAAPVSRL